MKKLQLTIVSPEKKLFQGEVNQVTLPGVMGSFTILPQHAPIVTSLTRGKNLYVTAAGKSQNLEVMGGFVEMNDNNVSVCIN